MEKEGPNSKFTFHQDSGGHYFDFTNTEGLTLTIQQRFESYHECVRAMESVKDEAQFSDSAYAAAEGADAVALITEWNEFKYLNLERLRGLLRRPLIFDGRNLWEPERMRRLGFEYYSIGRKPVLPA